MKTFRTFFGHFGRANGVNKPSYAKNRGFKSLPLRHNLLLLRSFSRPKSDFSDSFRTRKSTFLTASLFSFSVALFFLILLATSCGGSGSWSLDCKNCFQPSTIVYQGEAYGDMIPIVHETAACMGVLATMPEIILTSGRFNCDGVDAYGCTSVGSGPIIMDRDVLISSKGELLSHELTHFYGDAGQANSCGHQVKDGFGL